MIEKAESPYVRAFVLNWLHFDFYPILVSRTYIETSQLFFRDVIKFASFQPVSEKRLPLVASATCRPTPKHHRTQEKACDTQGTR